MREVHASARVWMDSPMDFLREGVFMGSERRNAVNVEYRYRVADAETVKIIRQRANAAMLRDGDGDGDKVQE